VDPALLAWVVHLIVKHLKSMKEKLNWFVTCMHFNYLLLNIYPPVSSPPIVPVAGEKGSVPLAQGTTGIGP
jgi:hypothetical protein